MVRCRIALVGLLLLQIYVNGAPSDVSNVEELNSQVNKQINDTTIEEPVKINEEPKLDSLLQLEKENRNKESSSQNLRQKRFYNFYGVPPTNPAIYPPFNKRDQSAETGVYGYVDDPLEQIQRRLLDIASFVRQPIPPPPPPSHFPFYFPVFYIPQFGCDCNSDNGNPLPPTENPPTPSPPMPKPDNDNTTADERFPQIDDERQNWGIINNETDTEYDEEEFARPISFDPIAPNRPTMRPAPPVDHGSSQGNSEAPQTTTTTPRPRITTRRSFTTTTTPSSRPARPGSSQSQPYPPNFAPQMPRNEKPTTCDAAILSCCHQPQVTYDCFVAQGCPDTTAYGNPCNNLVIFQVIEKYQKFYGVRNEN